jgi:hypothetical protein
MKNDDTFRPGNYRELSESFKKNTLRMKNIYLTLLFISTSLFAQQYETDWNKVIKNENVGKIKTANKIVDKIYKKAVVKRELICQL